MTRFRLIAAFLGSLALTIGLAGCGAGSVTTGPVPPPTPTPTPSATLSTTTLTFAGATIGTPTAAQTATLSNAGTATLTISGITLGGTDASLFTLTNNCGATLAAGSSCTLSVTFTATDIANRSATITLVTNATPASQTITLSGGSLIPNKCAATVPRKALPAATPNFAGKLLSGKVVAGTQPVIGASVQLYAAGNTGNGLAPTAIGPALTTDATGAFSLTTAYTCPFNLSTLYLVSRGGKAGLTGTANTGIVLVTTLGACNALTTTSGIVINEATTVASAYALAQFLSPGGNVGASATNFNGLALAAGTVANLVNITTGIAPGPAFPATGTAPLPVLNSLANALNACIVSAPVCTQLYTAATVATTVPTNTLDAILNIARYPGSNVAALYTVSTGSTAFTPAASAAPTDWTLFVTYSGGGMHAPSGIGIDSVGNVRVANYFSVASFFSNTGTPTLPAGVTGNNLFDSYGLAVDQNDSSWIPNEQSGGGINGGVGTVTVLDSSGQNVSGPTGFSQGGQNFPVSITIDSAGTSWVVDYGNSHLTLLSNSGTPLSGATGYTSSQLAFPVAVGVDSKCYGFVANQATNTITRVPNDGSSFTSFTTGSGASGVAIDASDNVWVANYYDDSVGLLSNTARILSSGGFKGGGLSHPQGIAVDGAGNIWVANYRGPSLTELAGANATIPGASISPAAGFGHDAALLEAFALALDAGGNIWVTNFGSNTLTEFIGMAAPVRTPLLGPVALP